MNDYRRCTPLLTFGVYLKIKTNKNQIGMTSNAEINTGTPEGIPVKNGNNRATVILSTRRNLMGFNAKTVTNSPAFVNN